MSEKLPDAPDWLLNWCALNNYVCHDKLDEWKWRLVPNIKVDVMDDDWQPEMHCYPSWTLEIFLRSITPDASALLQTKQPARRGAKPFGALRVGLRPRW